MDAIGITIVKTVTIYLIVTTIVLLYSKMKRRLLDCYSFNDAQDITRGLAFEIRKFLISDYNAVHLLIGLLSLISVLLSFIYYPFVDSVLVGGKVYFLNLFTINYAPQFSLIFLAAAALLNSLANSITDEYALKKSNIIKYQYFTIVLILLTMSLLGLFLSLNGSTYVDLVSNQRTLSTYNIVTRPLNALVTFICFFALISKSDEEEKESIIRIPNKTSNISLLDFLFGNLFKISLALNFCYIFLGGHSILPPLGYLSRFGEWFHCLSQIISLVIKAGIILYLIDWMGIRFKNIKEESLMNMGMKYFIPALVLNEVIILVGRMI